MADRHGEPVCTCEPLPTGEPPEVPDRDCPMHGQVTECPGCGGRYGPPVDILDVPEINGEPAW